ncbi:MULTISPECIES: M48 family metallopeptidase [Niveibacterium]|uniref:M48 family metallopeptidase n=1 Tax=Niveibacterium microcysteis TaxID=2811415 RepID=A0ABX7M0Y4_9RHOO|nr:MULTISPECIES: M48 family metallopeptidase [Niveibacterium]QSI75427.1 M48 family metallopeptidase [Niveibacterium microcysteis]
MAISLARAVPVWLLCGIAVACATVQTTAPGTVGVDRKQTVSPLVNRDALNKQAASQYRQVVNTAEQKKALNVDHVQTERVRRIAARLTPTVAAFRPDAVGWHWEVNVLTSKEVNAWCMPGGKIAVYSGLIDQLKITDDELAAVMGHEIAHALREHAWERASQAMNAQIGLTVIGIALGASGSTMDMAGMAYQAMFALPNSREQETEADRIGVELAARAGYDPRAAISLWDKMGRLAGNSQPQWLSTHPSQASRQKDLAVYSAKVMPLYEQATERR